MNALRILAMALGHAKRMADAIQLQRLDRELRLRGLEAQLQRQRTTEDIQRQSLELREKLTNATIEKMRQQLELQRGELERRRAQDALRADAVLRRLELAKSRGLTSELMGIINFARESLPVLGLTGTLEFLDPMLALYEKKLGLPTVTPEPSATQPDVTQGVAPTPLPTTPLAPPTPIAPEAEFPVPPTVTPAPTPSPTGMPLQSTLPAIIPATPTSQSTQTPVIPVLPSPQAAISTTEQPSIRDAIQRALAGVLTSVEQEKNNIAANIAETLARRNDVPTDTVPEEVEAYAQRNPNVGVVKTPKEIIQEYVRAQLAPYQNLRDMQGAGDKIVDNYLAFTERALNAHATFFENTLREMTRKISSLTRKDVEQIAERIETSAVAVYNSTGVYPAAFNGNMIKRLAKEPDQTKMAREMLALRKRAQSFREFATLENLKLGAARLALDKERLAFDKLKWAQRKEGVPNITKSITIGGEAKIAKRTVDAGHATAIAEAFGVQLPRVMTELGQIAVASTLAKHGLAIEKMSSFLTGAKLTVVKADGSMLPPKEGIIRKILGGKVDPKKLNPEERLIYEVRKDLQDIINADARLMAESSMSRQTTRIRITAPETYWAENKDGKFSPEALLKISAQGGPSEATRILLEKIASSQSSNTTPNKQQTTKPQQPPKGKQTKPQQPAQGGQAKLQQTTKPQQPPQGGQTKPQQPPQGGQTKPQQPPKGGQAKPQQTTKPQQPPQVGQSNKPQQPPKGGQAKPQQPPRVGQTKPQRPPKGGQTKPQQPPQGGKTGTQKPQQGAKGKNKMSEDEKRIRDLARKHGLL